MVLCGSIELDSPLKRRIYFDEENHKYTDDYNTKYTSVITIIGKYEIPFDREYWLSWKAKKLGVTVESLGKEWDDINKEACDTGNEKHNYLENEVNSFYKPTTRFHLEGFSYRGDYKVINKSNLDSSTLKHKHPDVYRYLIDLIDKGFILYAERRIYNYQLGVCGTIDILAVRDKEFIIVDWKTNKKPLYFKAGYFKKRNGIETDIWVNKREFFKEPLGNIPFCKGEIYTMQLSTYAFLVEVYGMTCVGMSLWHLRENKDVMYSIKYRKESVKRMLEDFYNRNR